MPKQRVTIAEMNKRFPTGDVLGVSLYALPRERVLYVRNPKVACSTLILWLHRIYNDAPEATLDNVHRENTLPPPRETGWRNILQIINGEGTSFTFVRHPISRAASAYKDKVLRRHRQFAMPLAKSIGLRGNPLEPLSVDQFVDALHAIPIDKLDIHFRPQNMNLMHGLVEFSHIGKLEQFDADIEEITKLAELPDIPWETRNVSHRPDFDPFAGRPDIVRRLEDFYADDFEIYGY